MSRLSSIFIALAFLAMTACGQGGGKAWSRLDLTGGSTPSATLTSSVVRIAASQRSYCTGVLVANDLVLTAAHCLTGHDASELSVVFPLANAGDQTRQAARIEQVHADSLAFFPNFDLGWILLSRPAPGVYKPAAILGDSAGVAVNTPMNLVGASNETACNPGDANCKLTQLSIALKSIWSSPHLINLAVIGSLVTNQTAGTCPGDSGGPSFVNRNGQDLLFGIVAGKDPIFTGGESTSCGSPTTVLTRIGEYQAWIESTSGRRLTIVEPAKHMLDIGFLLDTDPDTADHSDWLHWFTEPKSLQSSWVTVHKILEQLVLEFQGQLTADMIPGLFQSGGREWVERLTSLKSLTLGFPEQTIAITDLRPLAGLINLQDLTFLTHDYEGLDVIARLTKLRNLTIVGRNTGRTQDQSLDWGALRSDSVTTLKLNQLAVMAVTALDWGRFTALQSLQVSVPIGKVPSSWLQEDRAPALTTLAVQEFSCDGAVWPKAVLPQLQTLTLRTTSALTQTDLTCINWSLLPNLKTLSLQGYRLSADYVSHLPSSLASQVTSQSP